jgi:sugar lactone lactonase YvrE
LNGSNVKQLYDVEEPTIGNIAIDANDALYFSDTSENGGIYRLDPDGSATLIAKVPYAENLTFGSDGSLIVTRTKSCPGFKLQPPSGCHASVAVAKKRTAIVKVDINTGRVVDFHYPNYWEYGDSTYITVDSENNLWVRVRNTLYRLSPQGGDIPYSIFTDIVKDGYEYRFGPAGGISFDNQGRIWLASGNSSLWLLDPLNEEEIASSGHSLTETILTRTLIVQGFNTSDISIASSNVIYAPNTNNGDIWQIPPSGNFDVYSSFEYDPSTGGGPSILVDDQETAYLGLSYGSIIKINPNGSRSSYVKLFTRSMTFGADGLIYAVGGDVGKFKEIVQIDKLGNAKTLAIDVAGTPLGNQEVHIAIDQSEGFYVFREENSSLYFLDYEDNSHFIADLTPISDSGPVVMTSSPTTGDIYLAPQETSTVFIIDPKGNSEIFASGFIGEISAMAVSHDGKVLYIAEAGAIDRIFLSNP